MKKLFVILLLFASLSVAKDTTDVHLKDTMITKSYVYQPQQSTNWTLFLQSLPYLISFGGLVIALWTIRNQKLIAQAQIDGNAKLKWIDDVIITTVELQKITDEAFAYFVKKSGVIDVTNDIEIESVERHFTQMEFYANKLDMYLSPHDDNETNISLNIRDMLTKLTSFRDIFDKKETHEPDIVKQALDISDLYSVITVDMKYLIADKRNEISELINKKSFIKRLYKIYKSDNDKNSVTNTVVSK